MFFKYNIYEEISDKYVSLKNAELCGNKPENTFIEKYIANVCRIDVEQEEEIICSRIKLNIGFPCNVLKKIEKQLCGKYTYEEEAYCIETGEITTIYAETERGIIHAISTLKQMLFENGLKEIFLFDRPYIKMRGLHSFIPGRDSIDFFKQMVDEVLVKYKYNFMWLEVGGAMEYKRHPKINIEWEKYGQMLLKESGLADKIQHYTYPWAKNAIHPENGGGSYLTQEELKDIIKYCRDRGIDVFPDIPLLSHTDYILRAYPELNEREEDKDPDTYCPSNPRTYEVVFDIIDEVIEVFGDAEYVSIGHDEVVTIGICDKCKDKDPVSLFVGDILKIYDHLKKHNKKVLIWSDKFTRLMRDGKPYVDEKGKPCGGLQGYEKGDSRYVPALYTAIDRLPEDVIINDWYWCFNFDSVFQKHEVILSNFTGMSFEGWKNRTQKECKVKGISASNWGGLDYISLQRNGILFNLMYNSHMGWNEEYDDIDKKALIEKTMDEMHDYYRKNILKMAAEKKYIKVDHTTDFHMPYRVFYDGDYVAEEDYHIGDYVISYADGTLHREPVRYGENISNMNLDRNTVTAALIEVSGMTVPKVHGGQTYYKWIFENPYPDKVITDVSFETAMEGNFCVLVRKKEYA